jgi:hypothetical protein
MQDGHTYTIEFGDTSLLHNTGNSYYRIYDVTDEQKTLKTDTIWIDETSQSPIIDGFTVFLQNDEADLDFDHTGWVVGNSTYRWRVNLDKLFAGRLNLNINYPADFEVRFSDSIIDTAENKLGFPPRVPVKFRIMNITENKNAHFQFREFYEVDSTLSPYYPWQNADSIEAAVIWVEDPDPENALKIKTTWRLYFEADDENDWVESVRASGAIVLQGDATDPTLLKKARIERAKYLLSVMGDDGRNAQVAVHARRLSRGRRQNPLTCVIHIFDSQLYHLLREKELDAHTNSGFRLQLFNIFERGARQNRPGFDVAFHEVAQRRTCISAFLAFARIDGRKAGAVGK